MPDCKALMQLLIEQRNVDELLKLLGEQDSSARIWAAWGLGQLRDPRAVDALIETMNHSPRIVIAACIEALGELGERRGACAASRQLQCED